MASISDVTLFLTGCGSQGNYNFVNKLSDLGDIADVKESGNLGVTPGAFHPPGLAFVKSAE